MPTDQTAAAVLPDRTARQNAPTERGAAGYGAVALHTLRVAGAWARRVAAVVRPTGWILIGIAVAAWATGLWWGWREIILTAVILTAVIALSAVFLIGRSTYDVELDLSRSRVVVGEKAHGALLLRNTGARAILPSRVVLPVGSGRGVFGVGRMAPGEEVEELFAIPTLRRQVLSVGPVSIVRGDPFGLFERTDSRNEPVELYVHPKTTMLVGQSLGHIRDLEGLTSTVIARDDIAFHALTEYQPGDDLRHVHWRSTARTGTLMMRTYEETRRSHFVLGLSTASAEYASPDEFELAVSMVGSVGVRALRDAFAVDLRAPELDTAPPNARRLLDSLSGVEGTRSRAGDVAALGQRISADLPLASVVVLVCGGRVTTAQLREACVRIPHGARCLVIMASEGAEPALRRIGDADVVTVGTLDDLAPTVRRVLS
ncbi:DUF58 domain-containing protein [Microbacterium halotolerans]|uniref:DUF58 domain-containing protein n=1 Tax=Microbacterium halotolerans TaxID=246613 RepID=UPI000E6AD7A5|nr:DUF58 domain-containing protein [Microbacterium halotolerans]